MSPLRTILCCQVVVVVMVMVGGAADDVGMSVTIQDQDSEILTALCNRSESSGLVTLSMIRVSGKQQRTVVAQLKLGKTLSVEAKEQVGTSGYRLSDSGPSQLAVALEPSLSSNVHKDQRLLCVSYVRGEKEEKTAAVRRRPAKKLRLRVKIPQAEVGTNFSFLVYLLDGQSRWSPVFRAHQGDASSPMVYHPKDGVLGMRVYTSDTAEAVLLISNDSPFYADTQWRCELKGEEAASVQRGGQNPFYVLCKSQKVEASNTLFTLYIVIGLLVAVVSVLSVVLVCWVCRRSRKRKTDEMPTPIPAEETPIVNLKDLDENDGELAQSVN